MVSPRGVAPSRIVCVNLPLHHKVQKFSSGTGSPGRRAVKRLWCGWGHIFLVHRIIYLFVF